MRRPSIMVLATTAYFAGWLAAPSRAGFIADHGIAHAYAQVAAGNYGPTPNQLFAVGNGGAATGAAHEESQQTIIYTNTFNQLVTADAAAETTGYGPTLLKATASAYSQPGVVPLSYGPGYGMAGAYAGWTDIAFVNGPQQPNELDFTFTVEGRASVDPTGYGVMGLYFLNQVLDFSTANPTSLNLPYQGGSGAVIGFGSESGVNPMAGAINTGLTTGLTDQDGVVSGKITFRANYDPTLGGYGFGIEFITNALGDDGSAILDFMDTASLTKVSTADGTSVAVTFDSGMTLSPSAVPEPSSLAMLGVGLLGMAGWARRRARNGRRP